MIVTPKLQQYVLDLTPVQERLLLQLEEKAHAERIPIVDRATMHLMCVFMHNHGKVKQILEIGSATGYSALCFATFMTAASIHTIERDEQMIQSAKSNFKTFDLEHRITLCTGDAQEIMHTLEPVYDAIFIDAGKAHYRHFFEMSQQLLKPGGMIFCDNVFFHHHVTQRLEDIQPARLQPIVHNMKQFNSWLSEHSQFTTSFVPIGDGLAISVRK